MGSFEDVAVWAGRPTDFSLWIDGIGRREGILLVRDGGVRREMCVPDRGCLFWVRGFLFLFIVRGSGNRRRGVGGRTITTFDPPLIVEIYLFF